MSTQARQHLIDFAERVGVTFAFYFVSYVVTDESSPSGAHIRWAVALSVAGFVAATSALTTVVQWLTGLHEPNPYADALLRVVLTFVQGIVGPMAAAGAVSFIDFGWNQVLRAALLATGAVVLKVLAGMANIRTVGASSFVQKRAA